MSPTLESTAFDPPKNEKRERRLIKVDFSQLQDEEDEEEDHLYISPSSDTSGLWPQDECRHLFSSSLEAYDLATEAHSTCRRHTLKVSPIGVDFGSQSVPQSRPGSRQSCNSSEADSVYLEPEVCTWRRKTDVGC